MIGVWLSWNFLNYTNDITCRDVQSAALSSQEWHKLGPPAQVVDADKDILFLIGANVLHTISNLITTENTGSITFCF